MQENAMKLSARISNKHDLEVNWLNNASFVPMQGELIVYDVEVDSSGSVLALPEGRTIPYVYERIKIGDGFTLVNDLPFIDESVSLSSQQVMHGNNLLSDLINTYLLSVDYDILAFDTTELVVGSANTASAILGQAILGQMILA